MKRLAAVLALVLAGCAYVPPPTANGLTGTDTAPPTWRNVSAETGKIRNQEGLESLARSFPDSSSVHLRKLQAHFAAEDFSGAIGEAVWLARRGYVFSEGAQGQLIELAGDTAIAGQLKTLFAQNSAPKTASMLVASVPADAKLVETVAIDPVSEKLIVSTVVSRKLFRQSETGDWKPLDIGVTNSLSGLAYDRSGNFLWASSSDLGMTPEGEDLPGGIILIKPWRNFESVLFPAPEGVNLSDLTVAGFSVFASDPVGGGVYTVTNGAGDVTTVVEPGTFRSPQGLATDEQTQRLYVSDYRYGLAVVDLATGEAKRLRAAKPMILDGIDGLWKYGNRLIGIQNGMSPMRIVAITLSDDGYSATNLEVLEQAHPDWTEPLGGSIYDEALYYVATGQWDRFDEGGVPKADKPAIPTQVRRLPF